MLDYLKVDEVKSDSCEVIKLGKLERRYCLGDKIDVSGSPEVVGIYEGGIAKVKDAEGLESYVSLSNDKVLGRVDRVVHTSRQLIRNNESLLPAGDQEASN